MARSTVAAAAPAGSAKAKEGASTEIKAPLIIYTGALRMLVEEERFAPTLDRVIDVAESFGGALVGRRDDGVDIRVPSAHFRDALKALESVGAVTQRSVKAEDVSEQFHDIEVRLSNLKATQRRLQEFLVRAQNVNDALVVERELERIALEIDKGEGRLAFLRSRTSFSQIAVALQAKPKEAPLAKVVAAPPPRAVDLPVVWLGDLGLDPLLSLKSK